METLHVVVADFRPLTAPRTFASALAAAGDDRLAITRIDVVRDLAGTGTYRGVDELAGVYASEVGDVDCVVGYCSASVLAGALAGRIGSRPPVVLVNPTRPTVRQAVDDFGGFLAQLGAPVTDLPATSGGAATHAAMNAALRAALAALAAADGMDADEVEMLETELLARFDGWLGFLLAAAEDPGLVDVARTVSAPEDAMAEAALAAIREVVLEKGVLR